MTDKTSPEPEPEPEPAPEPEPRRVLGGPRTPAERVTIYEVAARAGVSIATVSHALNRPEKVSPATRERILAVVDELDFTPKADAVSKARKGIGRIGVLAPFTAYPSYLMRLSGVLEACRTQSIDVVVFDEDPHTESVSPWLGALPASGRLDGLLLMGVGMDEQAAARVRRRKLATVLVDAFHPEFSSVNVDDELGGYLLARHLLDRGYASFAYVSSSPPPAMRHPSGQTRFDGMMRALTDRGLSPAQSSWLITEDDLQGGLEAADDLLRLPALPRAVVAGHDAVAGGLLAGLRRAGVKVPEQVAITGYDGLDLARALGLTTMRQPFAQTGRVAARLLLEQLSGEPQPVQHVKLAPEFVEGETT
ncbi:DNA-binding LacI/PurR family transcriptional regulator [Catenulispora sp. MAP12-49]|uniref:LacI family DNA-binding transcriptional regulator n=1 Tax=Catenulispora sp. MAP12-49 TaxID=3156302 RepID=UPI003511B99D